MSNWGRCPNCNELTDLYEDRLFDDAVCADCLCEAYEADAYRDREYS